jgi:hypothetical protein
LAKNQRAEITVFQMSEVQESPAFSGRRSILTLRDSPLSGGHLKNFVAFVPAVQKCEPEPRS